MAKYHGFYSFRSKGAYFVFLIFDKNMIVGNYKKGLREELLKSTHNIFLRGEIKKNVNILW